MTKSLRDHLLNLNGEVLKSFVKQLGFGDKTLTRKAQFAEALEALIQRDPAGFVKALSESERLWLSESVHQCRYVGDSEFHAKFGRKSPWIENREIHSWRRPASLLSAVCGNDDWTGERVLQSGIVENFKSVLGKPAPVALRTVSELPLNHHLCEGSDKKPLQVFESESIAPVELARVLRLVQAGKIKVTESTRRPTEGSTRLVGETLIAPEFALEEPAERRTQWQSEVLAGPVRAHAWSVLLQQCGWAKPRAATLKLTPSGEQLLPVFSAEKYRDGINRFLSDGAFDELHRVNHIRGQTGKHKRRITDPGLRRSIVAEELASLPIGEWVEYKEALRMMNASGEDWNVMNGDGFLYICDAQYGLIYDHNGVNSQFLRAFLMESLATLGLVDIAFVFPHHEWPDLGDNWGADSHAFCGRYDGLRYVRLNSLGAYCLGAANDYALQSPEHPKLFRVLPNLDLVLAEKIADAATGAMLELLASRQSESVWKLDTERMLTHVESGGSFSELRLFLEHNAMDALPENVGVFLSEIESKLGACKGVRDALLLEWQDEALARLIASSAGLNRLCDHAGGNRTVVAGSDYKAFARALKKLGYVAPRKG